MKKPNYFVIAGLSSFACVSSAPGRADIKIQVERRVAIEKPDGGQPADSTLVQNPCFYFKGSRVREELPDGTVILFDRAADKVYTITTADRTYRVEPLKRLVEEGGADSGPESARGFGMGKVAADVSVKKAPADSIDALRQVSGREGKRFDVTMAVRREMGGNGNMSGGGNSGGGFPGGGFPGGRRGGGSRFPGGGRRPSDSGERRSPAIGQVDGEAYLAEAPDLGSKTGDPFLPIYLLAADGPGRAALTHKLAGTKGLPLYVQLSWKPSGRPDNSGSSTAPSSAPFSQSTTVTIEVKSISTDPLDDKMFNLPEGYKQADSAIK